MRKIYSLMMVVLMAATSVNFVACGKDEDNETKEEITAPDDENTSEEDSNEGNTPEEEQPTTPDIDVTESHDYVNLGLPSGTLWATCNIGAVSPADYGDYFAWGETEPKEAYDWMTYKWCNGSEWTIVKYCIDNSWGTVDNKTELEPSDDAATVNWGNDWCMPTKVQQDELRNTTYTTWTWTTKTNSDGTSVNGYEVVSKSNGNAFFLPAAWSTSGGYWSSSLYSRDSKSAYGMYFISNDIDFTSYAARYYAFPIRPVRTSAE